MNINLIYAVLKPTQTAVLHCNDDGTYTILINRYKPRDKQIQGVMHELSHINSDDFYSELQAGIIEQITHDAKHDADISGFTFYSSVI